METVIVVIVVAIIIVVSAALFVYTYRKSQEQSFRRYLRLRGYSKAEADRAWNEHRGGGA